MVAVLYKDDNFPVNQFPVTFSPTPGGPSLSYSSVPFSSFGDVFSFAQFHLHWSEKDGTGGAEHTVDGKRLERLSRKC